MAHTAHSTGHHGHHHSVPKKTLVIIFLALLGLTALTVATATQLELGAFNVPLALAIAGTKAFLVVAFFMALKYDSPVNRLVFTTGLVFVSIFLTFTLFDIMFRGDVSNVNPETIMDMERHEQELLQSVEQGNPQAGATAAGEQAQPEGATEAAPAEGEGGPAQGETVQPSPTPAQ